MLSKRQQHYKITVGDTEIVYSYIRKNGCSSWKKLFAGLSPHSREAKGYANLISFMSKYHKIRKVKELYGSKNNIVIFRDPVERLYSGFINRFVMLLDQQSSLHDSVSSVLQKEVGEVTFEEFLLKYIPGAGDDVDPHFWSQASHLADVEYQHKWLLSDLFQEAGKLFGKEVAESYFLNKQNATGQFSKNDNFSCSTPAGEMFFKFKKDGSLPSFDSLMSPEIKDNALSLYSEDVRLFNEVKKKKEKSR